MRLRDVIVQMMCMRSTVCKLLFAFASLLSSGAQDTCAQDKLSSADEEAPLSIAPEVEKAFDKIAGRLKSAKSTRATVELTSRALAGDEELQSERAVYQIASQAPDQLTVFFKGPVNCSGSMRTVRRHRYHLPMMRTCNLTV